MTKKKKKKPVALVALGGNALIKSGEEGTIDQQARNAYEMCRYLVSIIEKGYNLCVTHGNGPQVGNLLIRNEMARNLVPAYPLDVLVASTEGSIGYIFQQEMLNHFRRKGIRNYVVTMITQVMVDRRDPAFENPDKPVGPFYSRTEAKKIKRRKGWLLVEDSGRGFRRVVASPKPLKIIQRLMIRDLVNAGNVVIALGGGGVPIIKDRRRRYVGVDAVVDKDRASALLAREIQADLFAILTGTSHVFLNFNRKNRQALKKVTVGQMEKYMEEGHFPAGSMGPKIESAIEYIQKGGKKVIITDARNLKKALAGKAGTTILKDKPEKKKK